MSNDLKRFYEIYNQLKQDNPQAMNDQLAIQASSMYNQPAATKPFNPDPALQNLLGLAPQAPNMSVDKPANFDMPTPDAPIPRMPAMAKPPSVPMPAAIPQQLEPVRAALPTMPQYDDKELTDALAQQKQANLLATLGEAASQIGRGYATGESYSKLDPEGWNSIRRLGELALGGVKTKQEAYDKKLDRMKKQYELASEQDKRNPDSSLSKLYREKLAQMFPESKASFEGKNADELKSIQDMLALDYKYRELKEMAKIKREDRQELRDDKKKLEKEKKETVADKQVEAINNFDTSIDQINNALSMVRPNYTGPIDARVPDMFVGGDEAAFRSAVGRAVDSYRKVVTGAAAADKELARIESRLPGANDTFENFKAKATQFVKDMQQGKARYLSNLEKKGKNVENFKTSEVVDNKDASEAKQPASASFPRQVRKQGKVATVSNEAELKEAISEGWN